MTTSWTGVGVAEAEADREAEALALGVAEALVEVVRGGRAAGRGFGSAGSAGSGTARGVTPAS
jgi:hypothetical protein